MRIAFVLAAFLTLSVAGTAAADEAVNVGQATYNADCAKCHGESGNADTPVGKAMKAAVLAGKPHTLEQVTAAIRGNPKHKSVSSKVDDEQLAAVVEYIATLSGN
jgi:mono/diheme cytochrome c family protein